MSTNIVPRVMRALARTGRFPAGALITAVAGLPLVACGDLLGTACTSELRANLVVEVRDSGTGAPSGWGATGIAKHEDGRVTELAAFDSLRLGGGWAREQAGDYVVSVRKPGYTPVVTRTAVDASSCHVKALHLPVLIQSEYDVSADGQRFILVEYPEADRGPRRLHLIENFFALIETRLAAAN